MTMPVSAIEVGSSNAAVPRVIQHFQGLFNELDKGNLHRLQAIYSEDICFQDPFGKVHGLNELTRYFANAYDNVLFCKFSFSDALIQQHRCTLPWVMSLRHKRIRGGASLEVEGISLLEIRGGLVCYHRDYFDAGQLLYENLPVFGSIVRWVKRQAG